MAFVSFISRSRWLTAATYSLTIFVLMTFGANLAQAAEKPNLLVHIVYSAGWIFGPIMLAVSVGLTALCVLLTLDLRMSVAVPPGFVDEYTDIVNKRRFKEAFDMARNDTSYLARVLTAGMSRLQYGLEDAREAAANMLEGIRSGKEQKNTYTAVIGTLGPLLGLVGTVYGMILAFMALGYTATHNRTQKNSSEGHPEGARDHPAWRRRVRPRDFLQRLLSQPHHQSIDGNRPHRRRSVDANVSQLKESQSCAERRHGHHHPAASSANARLIPLIQDKGGRESAAISR